MLKKFILILFLTTLTLIALILAHLDFRAFGNNPDTAKFEHLPNFKAGNFVNRRPTVVQDQQANFPLFKFLEILFTSNKIKRPPQKLPEVQPDWAQFKDSKKLQFIWFGHSTVLVNLYGTIVLFDPIIANASPLSLMGNRFQPFLTDLTSLPEIDHIIISHDHYDHLDMKAIDFFKQQPVQFHVPLGVESHLEYWGVNPKNIQSYNWWDSQTLEAGLEIHCTPSQHFSGRLTPSDNNTLWASWLLIKNQKKVYFSGDTGYDTHFKAIGDRFAPIDLAFMENGQYHKIWSEVHLLPEQMPLAFKELKAKTYVPIHWGMFELALHGWNEPVESIYQQSLIKKFDLLTPMLGETLQLGQPTKPWWRF